MARKIKGRYMVGLATGSESEERDLPASRWPDVTEATRKTMRANKGKDTKPELLVRRLVHGMGYRYRLHRSDLPGKPDMTFGPRRAVIEVRGCFWHRHPGCRLAYEPKKRREFWAAKFAANVARDVRNTTALENLGWRVMTVWECETGDATVLTGRLRSFLEAGPHGATDE